MTPKVKNALFSVVRMGMDLDAPADLDLSAEDCAALMKIGDRQSIQPIVFRGLKRAGVPESRLRQYEQVWLGEMYKAFQRDDAINKVCAALDGCGVPYVLLKGAVLRHLYPEITLRTSCDMDVLVREEDLEKAVGALEAATDFRAVKRAYHDISMVNSRVHLELHFSIKENAENLDGLLKRAWDYAEPTGDGERYSFTPEYQIFYIVAHMCHHFLHGGLGVRSFLDLWLLENRTDFDEKTVRSMCDRCGILTFYEECCALARCWLEKAPHTGTTAMFEQACLYGGVFGSEQFKAAARQKDQRGLRYLLRRVFPPAYQVREFYGDGSGKKHTLAYYYAKRLFSWTGKKRRAQLKSQMDAILSSDREYLDRTSKLLKRLGL